MPFQNWKAVGCYFQTKKYILKSYFALEMIKLLYSIIHITSLEKLSAFGMCQMLELEGLLKDHQSNFTFKVVEEGPSSCSGHSLSEWLVAERKLGDRSPDLSRSQLLPPKGRDITTVPYDLLGLA